MIINIQIKSKADEILSNVGDMALKRRAEKILEGLDLNNGGNIIDVGCGDGFFLYLLSNLSVKVTLTGFDDDKIVLSNARKNLGSEKIKLLDGTAVDMPFSNNVFDKAIMTEVLEHIDDDKKALSEVYRILKPNGVLVLTVPNYNFPFLWDPINWILQSLFGTHIGGIGFFAGIWARHKRLYKKTELEILIESVGFRIEKGEQLTTRCLPFNHYLVNIVARILCNDKLPARIKNPLNKFKTVKKPLGVRIAFYLVNLYDKLNNIIPGKNGLNIYIKAVK